MNTFDDARFLRQMRATLRQPPDAPIAPEILDVIGNDPTARGALVLLLAQMLELPAMPVPPDPDGWFDDLDAFVDLELEQGIRAAAHSYPHVWWALWEDDECLTMYRALHTTQQTVQDGTLEPLRLLPTRLVELWNLSRQKLNVLFASTTPQLRMVARSDEAPQPAEKVLAEQTFDLGNGIIYQITLSIQDRADPEQTLIARVTPPPSGWLLLSLGSHITRVRFDAEGMALVAAVPTALLTQADGPDLQVGLELDQT